MTNPVLKSNADFRAIWKLTRLMKEAGWTYKASGVQSVICPHEKRYDECDDPDCVVKHVLDS